MSWPIRNHYKLAQNHPHASTRSQNPPCTITRYAGEAYHSMTCEILGSNSSTSQTAPKNESKAQQGDWPWRRAAWCLFWICPYMVRTQLVWSLDGFVVYVYFNGMNYSSSMVFSWICLDSSLIITEPECQRIQFMMRWYCLSYYISENLLSIHLLLQSISIKKQTHLCYWSL